MSDEFIRTLEKMIMA